MRLNDLIFGIDAVRLVSGDAAVDVRDITLDSRHAGAGALFAALPGAKVDGRGFVPAAVKAGATVVLAQTGSTFDLPKSVALLTADDPRRAVALFNRLWGEGKKVGGVFHSTC